MTTPLTIWLPSLHQLTDAQHPRTRLRLYMSDPRDPVLIIWIPGGPGQNAQCRETTGLLGRRSVAIPESPYPFRSYEAVPGGWDYIPLAFGDDSPVRVLSWVQWARYQGYRVVLAGHSNGVPRVVGYLQQSPRNQGLVDAVILSAGHVGGHRGPRLRLDGVQWNVPTLVMHHSRDHCPHCRPEYQHWLYDQLRSLNAQPTEMACLTTGSESHNFDCSGSPTHHMYAESYEESAQVIDRFVEKYVPRKDEPK